MASLYIKDTEANALADKVAALRGVTKTRAVKEALRDVLERLEPTEMGKQSMLEWLLEYRREHPLPPSTGFVADKAFYDSLNDEDDD